MLNLYELEQFVAFERLKTLTKVSEEFHISSPTVTRSMQNIEDYFKVELFDRSVNKISLNKTGKKAVEIAKNILEETKKAVDEVRRYDKSLRTINVKSCAPMPLWKILPTLSSNFSQMTISSDIMQNDDIVSDIEKGRFDIAILPFKKDDISYESHPYFSEQLYIAVTKNHELAKKKSVSFDEINGYNFLLRNQLGFWDTLCRQEMPASKFLVQNDDFEFYELIKNSFLPHFITIWSTTFIKTATTESSYPLVMTRQMSHFTSFSKTRSSTR